MFTEQVLENTSKDLTNKVLYALYRIFKKYRWIARKKREYLLFTYQVTIERVRGFGESFRKYGEGCL